MTEEQVYKVPESGAPDEIPPQTEQIAEPAQRRPDDASLVIGAVLIVVGALLLAGRLFDINIFGFLRRLLWPLYIVVPGVVLYAMSLVVRKDGEGLAGFASIVTTVGLLLFYQNVTGHWESWSYAWALVAPTSIGVGQVLYGALKGRQDKVKEGLDVARIGGIMFLIGAVFFELVIGISGFGLGRFGWPLVLIVVGLFVLVRNLVGRGD
jgi:hypothetical protein